MCVIWMDGEDEGIIQKKKSDNMKLCRDYLCPSWIFQQGTPKTRFQKNNNGQKKRIWKEGSKWKSLGSIIF